MKSETLMKLNQQPRQLSILSTAIFAVLCAASSAVHAQAFPVEVSRVAATQAEPSMVYAVRPGNATVVMSSQPVFHSYKFDARPETANLGQSFETPRAPIFEQSRAELSPIGDLNWVPIEKDGYSFAFDFLTKFRQEHMYVFGADAKLKRFVRRGVTSAEYLLETTRGYHYVSQRGIGAMTDYAEEKSLMYLCTIQNCWLPWSVVPVRANGDGLWVLRERTQSGQQLFEMLRINENAQILENVAVRFSNTPNEFTSAKLWRDRFGSLRLALQGAQAGEFALYNLNDSGPLTVTAAGTVYCDKAICDINKVEPVGTADWLVIDAINEQDSNVSRYSVSGSVSDRLGASDAIASASLVYRRTFTDVAKITASSSSPNGNVALRVLPKVKTAVESIAPRWVILDTQGEIKFADNAWTSANFGLTEQVFVTDTVIKAETAQHRARWFEMDGTQVGVDELFDQPALTPYQFKPVFDRNGGLFVSSQYAIAGDGKSVQVGYYDTSGKVVQTARLPDLAQVLDPNQTLSTSTYAFAKQNANTELWSVDSKSGAARKLAALCDELNTCQGEFAMEARTGVVAAVRNKEQLHLRKVIERNGVLVSATMLESNLQAVQIRSTANIRPNGDLARVLVRVNGSTEQRVYGISDTLEVVQRYVVPRSADNTYQLMSDGGVLLGTLGSINAKRRLNSNGNDMPAFIACGVRSLDDGYGGVWSIEINPTNAYRLCHNALNGAVQFGGYVPRWIIEYTKARILPDGDVLWQINNGDVIRARSADNRIREAVTVTKVRGPQYVLSDAASNTEYAWLEREIDHREATGGSIDKVLLRKIKLPQF
jgi:hypothetical protein